MTEERSLVGPAIALTPISVAILIFSVSRLETAPPWLLITSFAAMAVWVADWPHWVATKVAWSNTVTVAVAAAVLAPSSTAPLATSLIMMSTAIYAAERRDFQTARFVTNVGLLGIDGFVIGLAFEATRPAVVEPSFGLLAAIGAALLGSAVVAVVVVLATTAYRFGTLDLADHLRVSLRLPLREAPIALAVAQLAAVIRPSGIGWSLLLLGTMSAVLSFPIVRARLAIRRTDLITTVTEALSQRDLVGSPYARMTTLSVRAGRVLGMNEDELQQLRYVCLTYSMTDLFANELARPLDFPDQLRALSTSFSRVLFYGLALDDVSTPDVKALADLTARVDGLMYPEGGDGALAFEPALTEAPSKRSDQRLATALRIAASDNDKRMRAPRAMEYGYSYEPESRAEPD